jgi:acyl dehydratase
MKITSDKLQVGDKYDSLVIKITNEMNKQFLKALDDFHPRYDDIIHPGLLTSLCSITKSPSFNLSENVAAVGAKFKCNYLSPAIVGKTFTLSWEVKEVIEKRSRIYQISDVLVTDEDGKDIMCRTINNTFIGGEHLMRRVEWEKKTDFKREYVTQSFFPKQGYEIVGKPKQLTIEKLRYYSGGPIGPTWPVRNIHTDREISIRSGIGKPIASGMMFEAFMTELMTDFFGDNWFKKGEMSVICIEMAGDGDTILPKAIITNKIFEESKSEISMKLWCENQNRHVIMIGSASYKI